MVAADLALLDSIQRRVLWLATWMIHHANVLRPNPDGTKVGGHQASSASLTSVLTALYFHTLGPGDVVAVKAQAAPAFYAIQYLLGRLPAEALTTLRAFGGLQAYPSRRKNPEIVDLSTGSMGLGAVAATFGALATRYLGDHFGVRHPERFIVLVGDAELDEGNVWEALLEESVATLGNLLWIVDLNRQSLDRVAPDARRHQLRQMFAANGWHVIALRWGGRLRALFEAPGGGRLRQHLEAMSNTEYHALLRCPPAAARKILVTSSDGAPDPAIEALLSRIADDDLPALCADVGGHDLAAILEALDEAEGQGDRPSVILADTIKGWGLPLAADAGNHGALLTTAQIEAFRAACGVAPGEEWQAFPPGSPEAALIRRRPALFSAPAPVREAIEIPDRLDESYPEHTSTQEAFGRALGALARRPAGDRIVTLSADVAVTTHLAGWINRKGVYSPTLKRAPAPDAPQAMQWRESPAGQHVEIGIAEHNLFLALAAFGLTRELSGVTLLPVGTLYDPFVTRGLDALYHALYAGARFILAATPSGVSLSPEGGAHQSVITPGIGIALPGIVYHEPAFAQEVEWILLDAMRTIAAPEGGESRYLRLSTKPVDQSLAPPATEEQRARVLRGGYRLMDGRVEPGWDPESNAVHIFAAGVMVPEAVEASRALRERGVWASVFAVTSPDLLYRDSREPRPYLESLVSAEEEGVPVVSVLDGHSHALSFIGAALGVPQMPLGVDAFGQSGTRQDLYRHYGIDAPAIERAAMTLLAP
ncbi:MAG: pyruvate dehydrogenase [candidate division NC10 bacterium]